MNKISFIITLIFYVTTAFLIYFLYCNFQPLQQTMPLFFFNSTVTVPIFYVVIGAYLLSGLINPLIVFAEFEKAKNSKRSNPLQDKRVEKMSVDKETAEMKVRILEEKIKTLEVALEKALKRN